MTKDTEDGEAEEDLEDREATVRGDRPAKDHPQADTAIQTIRGDPHLQAHQEEAQVTLMMHGHGNKHGVADTGDGGTRIICKIGLRPQTSERFPLMKFGEAGRQH